MIFSMVPATAFAAENDGHDHADESIASEPKPEATDAEPAPEVIAAPTEQAVELKDRINAVLLLYGITADMTEDQINVIREIINNNYLVEGDLRRDVALNIKRLVEISCYRGIRHRRGLPVRGQKTKTNARTRKGPKRAVASKRKK